jgi:hypothetical protein
MNRKNLSLISQPGWRVVILDQCAKALGLLAHVEGIPIGSQRMLRKSGPVDFTGSSSPASVERPPEVTAILLDDLRRNGPIAQALNSRDDPLF